MVQRNVAKLLELGRDRRKSKVRETPRVVHGSTWVDLHAMARSKRVLAETQKHVNVTTRTAHPPRKHNRRTELALCHDVTLDIVTHRWVPARHPRYICVHYGTMRCKSPPSVCFFLVARWVPSRSLRAVRFVMYGNHGEPMRDVQLSPRVCDGCQCPRP